MARELVVKVIGDTAAFERSMKKASAQSNAFATSFAKAESRLSTFAKRAAIAGGAAGLGALALGSQRAIKAASSLNESINAVNVTFGEASKQILDFGKTAAQTTGLSARQVNESATVLGAALQNVGFSAEEAAQQTITLTQRAADMASVFNTDVDQALGAIQAALRGEADPIERFGVGLADAAVKAKALELGLARTEKAITATDKAQARLALIMEQTNKVAGDFAETSGGAANQQRILRAQVENLSAQIGQKLLPVVSDVLAQVLEWTTALEENEELQRDVENAVRDVIAAGKTMASTADDVADAFGGWGEAIKLATGAVVLTKLGLLLKSVDAIKGTPGGKGGVGGTGALGVASVFRIAWPLAIAAGVGQALKNFEPFQKVVDDIIDKVGNIGGSLPSGTGGITIIGPDGLPVGTPKIPIKGPADTLTDRPGGLQLPTAVKSDHPTAGLAGFPAKDIFAKPGTPVRAPENGYITRVQGSATTTGGTYGWGIYFLGSQTGNTYFIKHLATAARPGFYKKGAVIGTVSPWADRPKSSHVHLGIHPGKSPVASPTTGDDGGGGREDTAKVTTKDFQPIPIALRTAIAEAELTKSTADDARILAKIRAHLRRLLDSKKIKGEDRIEVINALKSVNSDIERIEDKHAEKLKEKARKKREAMLSAFKGVAAAALKEFDRATAAGLSVFDELTPAEKELAAFRKQRSEEERQQRRLDALRIEDPFEREQRLRELDLEDQEATLEARALAEREARDKEKAAYEEKREEDRNRLEVWLEQQEKALGEGRKSWEKFYKDLRAIAIRYGFPVGPVGPAPTPTPQAARAATSGLLPGVGSAAGGHVLDAGPIAPGPTVILNVAGSVQTERDLVYAVRDGLNRISADSGGNGLVG